MVRLDLISKKMISNKVYSLLCGTFLCTLLVIHSGASSNDHQLTTGRLDYHDNVQDHSSNQSQQPLMHHLFEHLLDRDTEASQVSSSGQYLSYYPSIYQQNSSQDITNLKSQIDLSTRLTNSNNTMTIFQPNSSAPTFTASSTDSVQQQQQHLETLIQPLPRKTADKASRVNRTPAVDEEFLIASGSSTEQTILNKANHNDGSYDAATSLDRHQDTVSSYSSVHPLLIYSIRNEIRSFDLFNVASVVRSTQSTSSHHVASTNSASIAFYESHTTFNGRNSKTLKAGLKNTIGLDFYYSDQESFIFWSDVVEERIYKGTLSNGTITNVEMLVQSGLATAEGLAVDWIGLNIYWVESTLDHIEVAHLNGSHRRTLIAGEMESPRAIAVDPRYGLLFWSDWDKKNPRIERATMSGDDRKILVHIKEVNGGWPNGITLDYEQLKIYWIDANSDSIHAVDYEGKNHQPLLKRIKSLGHPFSITLYENNLYWTDWKTNSVSMANKHNGSDAKELQRLSSRLFDIKVFHPNRQPRIDNRLNPCYINNGNCSHLCLLSLNHERKCDCPYLMKLSDNNSTCEADELVLLIGRTNEIRVVDMNKPLYHIMAPISVPKVFNPKQFEFDSKSRYIYWADAQTNEVKRAQLGSNNIETIIDVIIDSPTGLALDWISGNIYVTSSFMPTQKIPGKIYISNLRGEFISTLMDGSQGVISPKSIAVHPILGLLFCIDEFESAEPIIFSASMDGRHKRIIASKSNNPLLENPSNLAIDYNLNRVYWINQAENASIQYYDISEDKTITMLDENRLLTQEKIYPNALCVDGDYLIISARIPNEAIMKISINDLSKKTILRSHSLDQISALKVYNASSQSGFNACSQNNGGCSQLCIPINSTNRVCKCTIGYSNNSSDETVCIAKDLFLIYSYNLGMRGVGLEPSTSSNDYYLPPIHKAFRASSIDYVYKDNLIYWVDNDEGSIARINRDTTSHQTIVHGLESEESICIDWVAGNMYWLDPYYDIIEIARLNGTNRYVIVSGDMDKANCIVVNPMSGYIAWSDVGTNPRIETARLDGSYRKIIVSSFETHVDDLAIDYVADYIYWVDSALSLVERIKPDGTNRHVIYRGFSKSTHMHLISIAIYRDYLYIAHDSGQYQGSVISCNKNDGTNQTILHQNLGDAIRDIAIFAQQPQPEPDDNPCVRNNGGCQDLCLYMGIRGSKRCICSHGKLNQDGLTCKPYDTFIMFAKQSQIDSLHIKDDESSYNSPYQPIVAEINSNIISLTADYDSNRLIYSELTRDQICSVFFNGTDRKILVEKQSFVEGIAFSKNQLYWTSIQDNSITRYNTTSSGNVTKVCDKLGCRKPRLEKIIKLTHEDKLRGIAIDHCTSIIYWTNWNQNNPSIQRAGPHNGYRVESIITEVNIKVPNGIAIDQELRMLYWCDAKLDKIERSQLDGSNRIVLMEAAPQHPFALVVWQNYIFWTDWQAKGVFRADKHLGTQPMKIKKLVQRPMGLAVIAPADYSCPVVDCSINNGGCANNSKCSYYSKQGETFTSTRCVPINPYPKESETIRPKCHRKDGPCDNTYHDIIMDRYLPNSDNYNVTDLDSLKTQISNSDASSDRDQTKLMHNNTKSLPASLAAIVTQNVTTHRDLPSTENVTSSATGNFEMSASVRSSFDDLKLTKTSMHEKPTTPVTLNTSIPTKSQNETQIMTLAGKKSTSQNTNVINKSTVGITFNASTIDPEGALVKNISTFPESRPCQINDPVTTSNSTDITLSNECYPLGQFKCYLSDKLVCIPGDRRCDGIHDCPSKEDENDCYLSKRGPYNLKTETTWHRYVTVILIILAAAISAMFLVFGTRGRRRWFVGSNGAFNHRRMFDDNGTNIEISNPMFEEDDLGNLNTCTFSIDLNERTTNFSNPLYERQVLLMNDKHVTSE